jgi:hypothetical protein
MLNFEWISFLVGVITGILAATFVSDLVFPSCIVEDDEAL